MQILLMKIVIVHKVIQCITMDKQHFLRMLCENHRSKRMHIFSGGSRQDLRCMGLNAFHQGKQWNLIFDDRPNLLSKRVLRQNRIHVMF